MKKKSIIIFSIIFIITIIIIGYTALEKTPFPKKYVSNQFIDNNIYINEHNAFTQKFKSKLDILDSVSIKFREYENKTGTMLVEIFDEENIAIFRNKYDLSEIDDEVIRFNINIQNNAKEKEYTLNIKLDDLDSDSLAFFGEENNDIAIGQYGQEKGYYYSLIFVIILAFELFIFMLFYYKDKKILIKNKKLNNVITVIESLVFSMIFFHVLTSYFYESKILYLNLPILGILFILLVRNFLINLYNGKLEDIFLSLIIPVGTMYCIALVPGTIPDEPFHYNEIFEFLNGNILKTKYAAYKLPIFDNYLDAKEAILNPNSAIFKFDEYRVGGYSYLLYLPAIIGVFIGRLANLSTLGTLYLGSYFNFITFIVIGYYIIKYMPFCKKATLVYLFNPMLIHQVTSLSCDAMIIPTCLLFISYILYIKFEKKHFEFKDSIILGILALYVIISKKAYFPLLFLLLMIKDKFIVKNKINIKKILPLIFGIVIGFILVVSNEYLSSIYRNLIDLNTNIDIEVIESTTSKMFYLIHNPFNIIYLIFVTFHQNLSFYVTTFAGNSLGWFNINLPIYLTFIYYAILIISIFIDKDKYELSIENKILVSIIWLFNVAIIFAGLYLGWGELRDFIVEGVQGRYFIPINILLLVLLYNKNSRITFKNDTLIITLSIIFVNMFTLCYIIGSFFF